MDLKENFSDFVILSISRQRGEVVIASASIIEVTGLNPGRV
jgi:hypothetical protein